MNEEASRRGQLRDMPLPELLGSLAREQLTGVTRLKLASGPSEIYLVQGQVAAVELPGGIDRLAEVLKASGVIDPETIRRSLAAPRPPGLRYGRLLVESGLLPQAQLLSALRLQVKRRLHRLFFAEDGVFVVEPGEHGRGREGEEQVAVDVRRSVLLGVRSAWSEARFGSRLPARRNERLRLSADAAELLPFALSPAEQELLAPLARTPRSLEELGELASAAELSPSDGPTALRALVYALLATGAVALDTGDGVARGLGPGVDPVSDPAASVPISIDDPPPRRTGLGSPGERRPSSSPSVTPRPATNPSQPWLRSLTPPPPPSRPPGGFTTPPSRPPSSPGLPPMSRPSSSPSVPAATVPPSRPRVPTSSPGLASSRPAAPLDAAAAAALAAAISAKRASIDNEDLFQVLGVPRDADRAAIKDAYLQAARNYHPDRLASAMLLQLRPDAEYVFRRVSEAQATLTDDRRRAAYLDKLNQVPATQAAQVQRIVGAEMALREGDTALKQRDYATAIARLAEALRLNPNEGEAIALHAWARYLANKATLPDLRREFEQAVLRAPNVARAHYYLGLARKQANDLQGAMSSFRRAVDLDEHFAEAASELRVLQTRLGKKR